MHRTVSLAAISASILIVTSAYAQRITTIGQEVPFDIKVSTSGQEGQNEVWLFRDIKGTLVVFYFYRTTNMPSVEWLSNIQALHRKYQNQGVQFISVAADSNEKWTEFRNNHDVGFFHIYFWNARILYYILGAFSDPYIAIVDPRGRLIWRGVPDDRLDQRLADLIEYTHPPLGDPNWIERRFRQAEQFLAQREIGKAYSIADRLHRMTRGVPVTDVRGPGGAGTTAYVHPMQGRAEALRARCTEAARTWLREAVQLEQQGKAQEAARVVAEIAVRFEDPDRAGTDTQNRPTGGSGTDQAQESPYHQAALEIGRMNADRNLKKLIREAQDNAKGEKLNDEAAGLEEDGYYVEAKRLYERVIKEYKDTEAAKNARSRLRVYERDKTIQEKMDRQRALEQAWRWLSIGELYAGARLFDQARQQYRQLIEKYPDSRPAQRAKELLAALPAAKDQ